MFGRRRRTPHRPRVTVRLRRRRRTSAWAASATSAASMTDDGVVHDRAPIDPPDPGTFTALTYNVAGLPQGISGSNPEANMPQISPLAERRSTWSLVQEDFWYHAELSAEAHAPLRQRAVARRAADAFIGDGLNRFSQFPFEPVERAALVRLQRPASTAPATVWRPRAGRSRE